MPLSEQLKQCQVRVEGALQRYLPKADSSPLQYLHEAMRYSVLGGGKRIRPLLVYAAGMALDIPLKALDPLACAVEIIHVYSLIHDDLPAMDNSDLRRGRPSCHKAYDEAIAILAGDALQALAFYIIASDTSVTTEKRRLKMIERLAYTSGSWGMAGGQAMDLAAVGRQPDIAVLEDMYMRKTSALIEVSVELAALLQMEMNEEQFQSLSRYGRYIGLAFQIKDDILDVECKTKTLGKQQGSDAMRDKPTYPDLLGLAACKQLIEELHEKARAQLALFAGRAAALYNMADYIIDREN